LQLGARPDFNDSPHESNHSRGARKLIRRPFANARSPELATKAKKSLLDLLRSFGNNAFVYGINCIVAT
jgi:hypothetical protein